MNEKLIDLDAQQYVLASEIVAIMRLLSEDDYYTITPYQDPYPRCSVMLRNGLILPAYVREETLRKRWQAALDGEEQP